MASRDTKEQILDAAERLFAERGIEGTSLRALTAEAGVNLAAVHYHFGSKTALFRAVVARRFDPVNRERQVRLDALEASAGRTGPGVEAILEAFVAPALEMLERTGDPRLLPRLLARVHLDSSPEYREVLGEHFRPVIERFWRSLVRALPGLPAAELHTRAQLVAGTLHHALASSPVFQSVDGVEPESLDTAALLRRLIAFMAAGLRAPATATKSASRSAA